MHILLALFASLALLVPGTGIVAANMLDDDAPGAGATRGLDDYGDRYEETDDRFDFDEQFDFDAPDRDDRSLDIDFEDRLEDLMQRQFTNGQRGMGQGTRQNDTQTQQNQTQTQQDQTQPQGQQRQQKPQSQQNQTMQDTQTNGAA